MSATVEEIIEAAETELRLASGLGVQTYAEPNLLHAVQTTFDRLFLKRWWPEYTYWAEYTLDGTTGKVSSDLTTVIRDFRDIRVMFLSDRTSPLHRLRHNQNPYNMTGHSIVWEPLPNEPSKVFRVWPLDTTGTIRVSYRSRPATFQTDDTILLDKTLMTYAVAYDYVTGDGTNSVEVQALKQKLEAYWEDIIGADDDDNTALEVGYGSIPTEWH